jgi:hypothetical protein
MLRVKIIVKEGLDQEFRNLVQFGETFKRKFYEKYDTQRETFKENKFIPEEMFEIYRNKNKTV